MSMNKTWAISSWISFLTSAGIPIRAEMCAAEGILNRAVGRRDKTCLESPASCHIASAVAHNRIAVYPRVRHLKSANQRSKIGNCTVPVVQRIERRFPKRNGSFITLPQRLSQLRKLPLAGSLHEKLCRLTSSGVCPFSCSRVTQRVTQNSALFWLGADCVVALFVRCLGRGRLGELWKRGSMKLAILSERT